MRTSQDNHIILSKLILATTPSAGFDQDTLFPFRIESYLNSSKTCYIKYISAMPD